MKKYAKLQLMQNARSGRRIENVPGYRYEMENRMGGMENRMGDTMETQTRYNMDGGMGTESRRRRYEDGRFAPSNRYEGGEGMNMIGFNNEGNGFRNEYRGGGMEQYNGGSRMESGRSYPPEFNRSPSAHYGGYYQAEFAVKPMDEMQGRGGSKMHGGAQPPEFNEQIAKKWVKSMKRADGEQGEKWSMEEIQRLAQKYGIKHDPARLYAAMNADYADRGEVNKKFGITSPEYYMESAIAFWLEDEDAQGDKLAIYYECIAKK